jgi:hypothetical protein
MNTATPRIAAAIARASRATISKQSPSQLRPLGSRIQSIRTPTSIPQSRLFSVVASRRDNSKSAPAPGTSSPAPSKAPSKIYSFEEVRPTPPSTLPTPKLTPSPGSHPRPKPNPRLPHHNRRPRTRRAAHHRPHPHLRQPPPLLVPRRLLPPRRRVRGALWLREAERGEGGCVLL